MVHTYNPNAWEAEEGGLKIQCWPGLHCKSLSQKKKVTKYLNKQKYITFLNNKTIFKRCHPSPTSFTDMTSIKIPKGLGFFVCFVETGV
jgi:hypothetical protein